MQNRCSNYIFEDVQSRFIRRESSQNLRFSIIKPVIISLIFFSFLPYAGINVWTESLILSIIFLLGIITIFRENSIWENEDKYLFAPFLVLAIYSFAQGLITLLVQTQVLNPSNYLPYSFDVAASFWSALKFAVFAVFIKVLIAEFRYNSKTFLWILISIGNFYAGLGILRFLLQSNFPETFKYVLQPQLEPNVGFGTFINQNHFAFFMLMTFGLNLGLLIYGKLEKDLRMLVLVICLIVWSALVLTGSRGGIISSFVEIAVLILLPLLEIFRKHSKNDFPTAKFFGKKLTYLIVISAVLIVGIVLIGQNRVVERFEDIPVQLQEETNAESYRRIDLWKAGRQMIGENFPYGIGFGGFQIAVSPHLKISGETLPKAAHNDYLEFIVSGGLVAVICGIWFLTGFFFTLKKKFAAPLSDIEKAAMIGAFCAVSGIAVHSFFDFSLQIMANQLFLAGIISLILFGRNAEEKNENSTIGNLNFPNVLVSGFLLILVFYSLSFGYSRFQLNKAKADLSEKSLPNSFLLTSFESEFYETKAKIDFNSKNYQSAAENMGKAIKYRPQDYSLWLDFAKMQQILNRRELSETAFRRAVELAPHYGEPHFYYGKFLIAVGEESQGFDELYQAFQRNPKYFDEVLALYRQKTKGNFDETIKYLLPLDLLEKERLMDFLLDKKSFAAIAGFACRKEEFPAKSREDLITKLFEKRQFFYANRVFKEDCDFQNSKINFLDGDFENAIIEEGTGFGWRIGNLPDEISVEIDNENF